MHEIRPKQLIAEIKENVAVHQPMMIWGKPGIGKSDIVREVAADLGIGFIDFRANLFEPVDLRGIPYRNLEKGCTSWATPDILPNEKVHGKRGIILIDELPTAMPSTQTAFYQFIQDRKIGDYTLPEGWDTLAAGNRQVDRAATYTMPTPLKNRFAHYLLEPHLDDWLEWAYQHSVHPMLAAFLRFRPGLLHNFDVDAEAFPSPRTWMMVNRRIAQHVERKTNYYAIAGLVGQGAATEFDGFCRVYESLPDLDVLIANPTKGKVPKDEPATMYAIAGALAAKATDKTFENILIYADRMPPEFQVVLVRDALQRNKKLTNTACFTDWAAKNSDVLI